MKAAKLIKPSKAKHEQPMNYLESEIIQYNNKNIISKHLEKFPPYLQPHQSTTRL